MDASNSVFPERFQKTFSTVRGSFPRTTDSIQFSSTTTASKHLTHFQTHLRHKKGTFKTLLSTVLNKLNVLFEYSEKLGLDCIE